MGKEEKRRLRLSKKLPAQPMPPALPLPPVLQSPELVEVRKIEIIKSEGNFE